MISASRNARRRMKLARLTAALLLCAALWLPGVARAQGAVKLYTRQATLGGKLAAAMLVVGYERDAKAMERLLSAVEQRAGALAAALDWQSPGSEVARINAQAGRGPVVVSDDTVAAFEEAKDISKMTKGWFDIAAYGKGSYKDIKVNRGSRTVELKKEGMRVAFDGMLEGFVAEYMIRLISSSGMQNALAKVGNVFRGVGTGLNGPWKIQVQDDASTFARHALNLKVINSGIATISATEYRGKPLVNPKNKQAMSPPCKGVTVVMPNAAQAQGVAKAAFTAGPSEGYKLIGKVGKAAGLIVDSQGKFLRTKGF